jgi:hypothetical protein
MQNVRKAIKIVFLMMSLKMVANVGVAALMPQ